MNWIEEYYDSINRKDAEGVLSALFDQVVIISKELSLVKECQICKKIIPSEELSEKAFISKLPVWNPKFGRGWICWHCLEEHDKMCEDREYYTEWLTKKGYL